MLRLNRQHVSHLNNTTSKIQSIQNHLQKAKHHEIAIKIANIGTNDNNTKKNDKTIFKLRFLMREQKISLRCQYRRKEWKGK